MYKRELKGKFGKQLNKKQLKVIQMERKFLSEAEKMQKAKYVLQNICAYFPVETQLELRFLSKTWDKAVRESLMLQYHEMRPGVEDLKMDVEHAEIVNKTMTGVERLEGYEAARQAILHEIMDFRATEEANNPHAVIEVIKDAIKTIDGAPKPNIRETDIKARKKLIANFKKREEKISKFEFQVSMDFSETVM